MAELIISPKDMGRIAEGDIVEAISDRLLLFMRSQVYCHPGKAARNSSGLVLVTDPLHDWYELLFSRKVERISNNELLVTERGQLPQRVSSVDVQAMIDYRKRNPHNILFGEDGLEFWWEGVIDWSMSAISAVWNAIEAKTPHQRTDRRNTLVPWGTVDIRRLLAIRTESMSDEEAEELVSPEIETDDNGDPVWELEEDGSKIKRGHTSKTDPPDERGWKLSVASARQNTADWKSLLQDVGVKERDVLDPDTPIGIDMSNDVDDPRCESKDQPRQKQEDVKIKKPKRNP